jgi:hypothetical protein
MKSIFAFALSIVIATPAFAEVKDIGTSVDHSHALSGERTKMSQSYNLNPDCSLLSLPSEKITRPPLHGSIEVVKGRIFSHYKSLPLSKCNSRAVEGIVEYYTSKPGYAGTDSYKARISYGNGRIDDVTVNVSVIGE